MKILLNILFLPALLFMVACNGDEDGANDNTWPEPPEEIVAYMPVDLSPNGLPMVIWIPDTLVGIPKVVVQPYGETEISVGDYYRISIAVGADIALKRSDLAEDLLYKTEYIEDQPTYIMYKSALPDGSQEFVHFYAVIEIDGTEYEIKDIDDGTKYPQIAVKRMMESAKFVQPAVPAEASEGEES